MLDSIAPIKSGLQNDIMYSLEKAILRTLIYADNFDYPLTEEEIWERLIKVKTLPAQAGQKAKVKNTIQKLKLKCLDLKNRRKTPPRWPDFVGRSQDFVGRRPNGLLGGGGTGKYYHLRNRQQLSSLRQKRKKYSQKKLKIAQKITNLLRFIPSVKLIGITGALACNNTKEDDDIDLLIITSSGLLWTTRLLVTLLVELTGKRRHPKDKDFKNKICLNMFINEEYLGISKKERDLFTAHEVVQMKPLFEKGGVYQKFLKANQWAKDYLPNAIKTKNLELRTKKRRKSIVAKLFNCYIVTLLHCFELLLKNLQLFYMKKRRTTEVITDGVIRFHPKDAREWVLRRYMEKLKEYQISDR